MNPEQRIGPAETPDFEMALDELEKIVRLLERGDIPLQQALDQFRRGLELSRICSGLLDQADTELQQILLDASGEPRTVPLRLEEE